MRSSPRPRRYVSSVTLTLWRPLMTFDEWRQAYVLRAIGDRHGPVLRLDRRRGAIGQRVRRYTGPERRGSIAGHGSRSRSYPV